MSAHTPGKWFVDPNNYGDIQAEGTEIAAAFCEQNIGRKWVIQGPITVDTETCKANARLIAAAPELLAIVSKLALLREGLENGSSSAEHAATRLALDAVAVVAKATGGAT